MSNVWLKGFMKITVMFFQYSETLCTTPADQQLYLVTAIASENIFPQHQRHRVFICLCFPSYFTNAACAVTYPLSSPFWPSFFPMSPTSTPGKASRVLGSLSWSRVNTAKLAVCQIIHKSTQTAENNTQYKIPAVWLYLTNSADHTWFLTLLEIVVFKSFHTVIIFKK